MIGINYYVTQLNGLQLLQWECKEIFSYKSLLTWIELFDTCVLHGHRHVGVRNGTKPLSV